MPPRSWLPDVITQVTDRCERRLDEPWSLERLAHEARFSPFHFHRLFVRATGETPASFVERLRLERAALLLLASERPVTSLAPAVGFRRPETFTRRFRARFGTSPRDYRRTQLDRWSRLGLEAGTDPLGEPAAIRVEAVPVRSIVVRRRVGDDEGFCFDAERASWGGAAVPTGERVGVGLDWPGITAPGAVRQDFGRLHGDGPVPDPWVRRSIGGGLHATLSVAGSGPVPPVTYQRLFVWSLAGRYRLRPGPLLERPGDGGIVVHQPVHDTRQPLEG